jgi:hypothetical protein
VKISFLSVLPKRCVGGLRKLEHARSEVRGQIAEVKHHNFEGFTSAIRPLTSAITFHSKISHSNIFRQNRRE